MNSDKREKVKEIFGAALKCARDEREVFVENACQGDDEVRREVESLLSWDGAAPGFLERPAVAEVASEIVREKDYLSAGQHIQHYEIIRLLGSGGMGEVYLAHDAKLNRKVAIKTLKSSLLVSTEHVERFQQEARAASSLNHPNILTIHDKGQYEGSPYIVSEYIEGKTLRECLNDHPIRLGNVLNIVAQTAGALSAAHKVGIIHRDIKPENIDRARGRV